VEVVEDNNIISNYKLKSIKMKTKGLFALLMASFTVLMVFTTGCKDETDDPTPINYYEELTDYLVESGLDLPAIMTEWVITASALNDNGTDNYYIIDIRNAEDFAAGHIEGANNTTLANILTEATNADKPIVVVCYTGQTAAQGHVALRLSGYSNCKILKFGMSAWNGDFDSWTANVGNVANGHASWSTSYNIETALTFDEPDFTATAETGADILEERVNYMLEQGFKSVNISDVLETPTNYFINTYWTEAIVNAYGHFVGAYRIQENLSIADGGLLNLDPASTVVTYCWTGQISNLITSYLTVLGYDAKSLKFGANGLVHDLLQENKWTGSADYPYVTE
jgi:rhodanese-related sulfurtransferase